MRLLVLLAIALTTRAPDADACSCAPALPVASPSGADVPTNATVMIWVQHRYVESIEELSVGMRPARGKLISVDIKSSRSAETSIIELVPKQPLLPNTTYEVVISRAGNKEIVQTFTTSSAKATAAPAWKAQGIGRVRFVKPGMWGGGSCINGEPYLEVIAMPEGDAAKLRVGVWIGTKIDFTKPPTTYYLGVRRVEKLGDPSSCRSAMLTIPRAAALKVGFKLFDVAGNGSDGREVVVDTTKPEQEARP